MDKLHYYVCQTDVNLSKYIERAEADAQLPRDNRTLTLMNLCSDNVDNEDNEDEDGKGDEVDANDDHDGSNDDDNGYDIPESDTDSDAPVVNDEEAAELADMVDFVQEAFGGGSGQ